MKKTFKCSCNTQLIEIEYNNITEWTDKNKKKHKDNTPELWIGIYDIYNPNTGRKYKKPKLVADVEFMGGYNYAKEMDFIMHFLDDITTAYTIRKR